MKVRICAYLIALSGLMLNGCNNSREKEERYTWSTDEPLTIPFKTRVQRLEKGNLVRNYSFETGKIFKVDSSHSSFSLDGWQQIGQHVQWVDVQQDSVYQPDERYSGNCAVKIVRNLAPETDEQGTGVQSDFIKIIPGNYQFSFYARLEKVLPQKHRLGTKMFDGVDVRLLFYDRNKNLLKQAYSYPLEGQSVDISFKALSFANYRYINSTRWCKVIGKSNHYPFPEGDIPSEAQFVKIYIGLKGSGTLWIDQIDFQYSDRNFTVAERMQPYTDTSFVTPDALIPTPKRVYKMESVIYLTPGMAPENMPVILIGTNLDAQGLKAARILQTALQQSADRFFKGDKAYHVQVTENLEVKQNKAPQLIISIGKTNILKYYAKEVPNQAIENHQQGYYLYTPGDRPNLVLLESASGTGLYYGALTLLQMLDSHDPILHNARITDYPDFPSRLFTLDARKENKHRVNLSPIIGQLIDYKFNGAIIVNSGGLASFGHGEKWFTGDITSLFDLYGSLGYVEPRDSLLTYDYPLEIKLPEKSSHHTEFIFAPVFNNQMMDFADFSDHSQIEHDDAKLVYTGSSFFSYNTDAMDINRYTEAYGAVPVFMDNSMRTATSWGRYDGNKDFYPGKIRLFNIFEPFADSDIRSYFSLIDTSYFIVNLPVNSEIEIIRLATAADFMWNAATYSKDYSLWKVLFSRYGKENARYLVEYADKYGLILETLEKIKLNIQKSRNIKSGQLYIADLTAILAKISDKLGANSQIVKDLQDVNALLRSKLNNELSTGSVKK
jgi:hypothetical protein